ncbi:MAG TPA: hypothetical protein VKP00_10130, partial [Gemmatimonadaceae bacterium]|nr:hypothetical protein [Gemmatimonadaceae bacterium]
MSELPALIEERHRYEAWLSALDARRDSTPKHVFDRVQADYRGRLDRVAEQLAAHRQSIQDERASLESRLSLLKAEEQLRRDERAELDLRAHVGELSGAEAEGAFRTIDGAIDQLVGERAQLDRRVGELDALLEIRPRPIAPAAPAPAPRTSAAVFPSAAEPRASAAVFPPAPQPRASAAAFPPAPEPRAPAAAARPPEPPAAPPQREVQREVLREPQRDSQDAGIPQRPGGSFDELAFLSEVVGQKDRPSAAGAQPSTGAGQVARAGGLGHIETASDSLLAGLDDTSRRASSE